MGQRKRSGVTEREGCELMYETLSSAVETGLLLSLVLFLVAVLL